MINKNVILEKLAPFKNYQKVINQDQTVENIIDGILSTHEKYKSEYDRISEYFVGRDEYETGKNIYNFLQANVPYYIESTKNQTLRSPSAIVSMPGDCKSYSLFANGVWDSLNRKGIFNSPIAYRFADYRNIGEYQHVFSVINAGKKNEIWIDPVLKNYNEKKQPTSFTDKKIKMALIAMSGVNETKSDKIEQLKKYQNKLIRERYTAIDNGSIKQGSSKDLEYKVAINKVSQGLRDAQIGFTIPVIGINTDDVGEALEIAGQIADMFKSKPNPNDWVGWDAQDQQNGQWDGSSVRGYVLNDGDSVQNEALNIVSYINAKGIEKLINTGHPTTIPGTGWRDVTIEEIANKLARGGYGQEATDIKNKYFYLQRTKQPVRTNMPSNPLQPLSPQSDVSVQKAGMNTWLILGLVGAALFFITKKK